MCVLLGASSGDTELDSDARVGPLSLLLSRSEPTKRLKRIYTRDDDRRETSIGLFLPIYVIKREKGVEFSAVLFAVRYNCF